jgi:hypothetical protein
MRTIDTSQGRLHRHFAKTVGCRAYLRLPVLPSVFLAGWLHRPTGCGYWHPRSEDATRPSGWAGERP